MDVLTPPEYVAARSVLLDALEALGPHRDAAVLVGAQAVYLHSGDADLATAATRSPAGRWASKRRSWTTASGGSVRWTDSRSFEVRVAGLAALLVSKVIKIAERSGDPTRLKPKDGLDVLRLLRTADLRDLAGVLTTLLSDDLGGEVTRDAVHALRLHSTSPDQLVPSPAAAEEAFQDADVVRGSTVALVEELLDELDGVRR